MTSVFPDSSFTYFIGKQHQPGCTVFLLKYRAIHIHNLQARGPSAGAQNLSLQAPALWVGGLGLKLGAHTREECSSSQALASLKTFVGNSFF